MWNKEKGEVEQVKGCFLKKMTRISSYLFVYFYNTMPCNDLFKLAL